MPPAARHVRSREVEKCFELELRQEITGLATLLKFRGTHFDTADRLKSELSQANVDRRMREIYAQIRLGTPYGYNRL